MQKKKGLESEFSETVEEVVKTVFVNKADRKRMLAALFWLALLGVVIVAAGTYLLFKQQAVIKQNSNIDWSKQHQFNSQSSEQSQKAGEVIVGTNKDQKDTKGLVKMFFVGDLMLDRYNRKLLERKQGRWITEKIQELFLESDLNIANLEGPVTTEESVALGSKEGSRDNYIFTFDPGQTKKFLQYNKIKLVNLGNNHILNFESEGLQQTKDFLAQNKLEYFGDIKDKKDGFVEKQLKGIKLAFVSYNQFGGNGFQKVLEQVGELENKNDFTIVYTHWGEEYKLEENQDQREKAHQLIDRGADLIIGSHPHVVQPVELYKEKVIFYSLGNFVFDQYFSRETMLGLGVEVLITANKELEFALTPLQLQKNGQLKLASKEDRELLLKRILKTTAAQQKIKEDLAVR